jgi:two-component system cell cycle response regulator CtrA
VSDDLYNRQRDRIHTLEERVRQLEEILAPSSVDIPVEWGLTVTEKRVYACLATRAMASKAMIFQSLYSDQLEEPDPRIIDVFVCKLRKKLKPFGIAIATVRGEGYAL